MFIILSARIEMACFLCKIVLNESKNHVDLLENNNIDVSEILEKALDEEICENPEKLCGKCATTLKKFYDAHQLMNQLKLEIQNKYKKKCQKSTANLQIVKVSQISIDGSFEKEVENTNPEAETEEIVIKEEQDFNDISDLIEYETEFLEATDSDNLSDSNVEILEVQDIAEAEDNDEEVLIQYEDKYFESAEENQMENSQIESETVLEHGITIYTCSECGKEFANKRILANHVKIHTDRPRNFQCSICDKRFLTQQNLTMHENLHNPEKVYTCDICGKSFSRQSYLKTHKVIHSEIKPYFCGICGKRFAKASQVKNHHRVHTGEKPFTCDICGAAFAQYSNLSSHKGSVHLNDLRFKCEECGKGFKRRRLLVYHTRAVHTEERPFSCSICHSAFVCQEQYKKHYKKHERD